MNIKSGGLSNPLDVLHKLEREMHRAFHHQNYIHKLDHFYNFCITSLALEDRLLSFQDIDKSNKNIWRKDPSIKAVSDIAISVKHFDLWKQPETKAITRSKDVIIEMYLDEVNNFFGVPEEVIDYEITLFNDRKIQLYELMTNVINFWKACFKSVGIKYEIQRQKILFGDKDLVENLNDCATS